MLHITYKCLNFYSHSTQLPYPSVEANEPFDESVSLSRMTRRRAMLFTHFVNRFQHEYLAALREHHSHQQTQFHVLVRPLVGDLVLIHDEFLPRTRWKLGVIEDLLTGPDKIPRAAIVRTARGRTSRPLSYLYLVEDTNKVEETVFEERNAGAACPAAGGDTEATNLLSACQAGSR